MEMDCINEKAEWVQIKCVLLSPEQRTAKMPDDTRGTPYVMYARGFLSEGIGEVGETVTITTLTGRSLKGVLEVKDPVYEHSFGRCVKALVKVGAKLKNELN